MGRPTIAESKDTKVEIAKVAMELIQTRGFHAFSYQDIADRLKIRKASIHYYYPSKEDLGVSMIERSYDRATAWREQIASQKLSPTEKMNAYFEYFATISDHGKRICPCGSFVSEWGALTPQLKAAVARHSLGIRTWLKVTITAGRKSGEFSKEGTAEDQAQLLHAGVQGALQSARVQENFEIFRIITRQLLEAISV